MNFNEEISDYIQKANDDQIEILETIRQLIHTAVPGTTEAIKWKIPVFAKDKDYAYLRFAKKHITLGFYNIGKIEDPNNLLEGTGSTLRHIKIRKVEDIDEKLVTKWLKAISA